MTRPAALEQLIASGLVTLGTAPLATAPSRAAPVAGPEASPTSWSGDVAGTHGVRPYDPVLAGVADDTWVPVAPALAGLLPGGALRRGTVVSATGSASLVLALLAEASAGGAWCAEVGEGGLGMVAASEAGVALDRFVRVPSPGERWPEVVAALLDGFDLVVVHPWAAPLEQPTGRPGPRPVAHRTRVEQAVRRLTARVRERKAVLLATWSWTGAALGLEVTTQRWHGLEPGEGRVQGGHLSAREVVVTATGRGAAVRPRRARLWLPGPDGRVALVSPGPAVAGPVDGPRVAAPARLAG